MSQLIRRGEGWREEGGRESGGEQVFSPREEVFEVTLPFKFIFAHVHVYVYMFVLMHTSGGHGRPIDAPWMLAIFCLRPRLSLSRQDSLANELCGLSEVSPIVSCI